MLKKKKFIKYTVILIKKKSSKKGNETFTTLFLFWIGKPNIALVSLTWWWISFLNVPTLKLRIIVFPTYQPKIIIPTNYTDNYPAKQKFKLPSPYALYRNTLNDEHHFKFPITKFQTSPSN